MANRHFRQFQFGLEPMPVRLPITLTLTGANGAQTVTRGKGIVSAVQSGTGLITITLSDKYVGLLGMNFASQPATYSSTLSCTDLVLTSATSVGAATPVVVVQMLQANGSTVAAQSTDKLYIELVLNNSTAL